MGHILCWLQRQTQPWLGLGRIEMQKEGAEAKCGQSVAGSPLHSCRTGPILKEYKWTNIERKFNIY